MGMGDLLACWAVEMPIATVYEPFGWEGSCGTPAGRQTDTRLLYVWTLCLLPCHHPCSIINACHLLSLAVLLSAHAMAEPHLITC